MMRASENRKETPMVLAHFNKRELDDLDKAQGGKDINPKTGVRQYKLLGETFKDPKVQARSLDKTRAFYAAGGRAQIEKMKKDGRYGDTEMALVPHHLADHFDRMIGGKSINPHTKHREYFLGALISGLSAVARAAAPAIRAGASVAGRAASRAAGAASKLGSRAAGAATKIGSKAASTALKVGKAAAPTLGKIGAGVMQAAPDIINGYAQYQQTKDQQAQQARMMELMASMAQSRGSDAPQQDPQQQFNPYAAQGMNGLQSALYPNNDMPPMDPYSNPYFGY